MDATTITQHKVGKMTDRKEKGKGGGGDGEWEGEGLCSPPLSLLLHALATETLH